MAKITERAIRAMPYESRLRNYEKEKDQLFLTGNMDAKEELLNELNKFLRHVNLLSMQENLPYDLQTLMICE